eukprot:1059806-Pyramimonas_sp.AAC.1
MAEVAQEVASAPTPPATVDQSSMERGRAASAQQTDLVELRESATNAEGLPSQDAQRKLERLNKIRTLLAGHEVAHGGAAVDLQLATEAKAAADHVNNMLDHA